MYLAKEFQLEQWDLEKCKDFPAAALKACTAGSHRPVNPHRQRLLVARHKEAKSVPKAKAKPKAKGKAAAKATPKAKSSPKAKAVPCSKGPAKDKRATDAPAAAAAAAAGTAAEAKPAKTSKAAQCRVETDYAVGKRKFFEWLGFILCSSCTDYMLRVSLSLSLPLSPLISLSLSPFVSLSLSLSLSLVLSLSLSLSLCPSLCFSWPRLLDNDLSRPEKELRPALWEVGSIEFPA